MLTHSVRQSFRLTNRLERSFPDLKISSLCVRREVGIYLLTYILKPTSQGGIRSKDLVLQKHKSKSLLFPVLLAGVRLLADCFAQDVSSENFYDSMMKNGERYLFPEDQKGFLCWFR